MANKRAFNILCEQPETIAAYLVPRMRTVVARGGKKRYIRYLTPTRAFWFLLMAPLRMRRFFDSEGTLHCVLPSILASAMFVHRSICALIQTGRSARTLSHPPARF